MNTFRDVIAKFGSAENLARAIAVKGVTVRQWQQRESIPVSYWPAIIMAATESEIDGIDPLSLYRIATGR